MTRYHKTYKYVEYVDIKIWKKFLKFKGSQRSLKLNLIQSPFFLINRTLVLIAIAICLEKISHQLGIFYF